MRFITGLLTGILLTIGTAYVVDAMRVAPDQKDAQRMVNWAVVSDNLHDFSTGMQSAWAHVVSGAKDLDKKIEGQKT